VWRRRCPPGLCLADPNTGAAWFGEIGDPVKWSGRLGRVGLTEGMMLRVSVPVSRSKGHEVVGLGRPTDARVYVVVRPRFLRHLFFLSLSAGLCLY
jgi:hypothetical protein